MSPESNNFEDPMDYWEQVSPTPKAPARRSRKRRRPPPPPNFPEASQPPTRVQSSRRWKPRIERQIPNHDDGP